MGMLSKVEAMDHIREALPSGTVGRRLELVLDRVIGSTERELERGEVPPGELAAQLMEIINAHLAVVHQLDRLAH